MKSARNLGFPTKESLLQAMTAQQAQQWEVFASIEPFPEDKIIQALAHIAAIFANGTLKKKNSSKWKMDDFLIKYFTPPVKVKEQSVSTMKSMLYAIKDAFGSKSKNDSQKVKNRNPYRIKYEAEKYIPRRSTPPLNPVKRRKN